MADNFVTDPGTGGVTFASDDVGGVHYAISKLAHGALDSVTLVSTSSGLPVQQQGTWTVGISAGTNNIGDVDVLTQPARSHTTDSVRIGDGTDLVLVTAAGEMNVIASAQPGVDIGDVTVNNAAGASAVNIQDGGNSITVDGSVSITGAVDTELPAAAAIAADANAAPTAPSVYSFLAGFNGTTWDRIRCDTDGALHISDGLNSITVDNAGNPFVITGITLASSATSLGKAEDSAHTTGDTGVFILAVRSDAGGSLVSTDGDYSPLSIDSSGALRVTGGGGGTEYTEDVAAATDPTGGANILVRQDTPAGLTTADGDNVAQRGTNFGAAFVQVLTSSGSFVDTFGGGQQYNVNDITPADPTGPTLVMERDNALSTLSEGEGDWTNVRSNARGALWVELDTTNAVPVSQSGGWTISTIGNEAHDAVATSNPIQVSGRGNDTVPAATSADGDVTRLWVDRRGAVQSVLVDRTGDSCMDDTNNALRCNVVAGSAAGTEYNEDDATPATITGGTVMMERDDALSTLTPIEGDWAAFRCSSTGALWTQEVNSSAINTNIIGILNAVRLEDSVSGDGDAGMGILAIRQDTPANTSGTNGDYEFLQMSNGALWVASTTLTPGTGATNLGKAEDAAHTSGDVGVMAMGVRQDTLAASTSADGDYAPFKVTSVGRVYSQSLTEASENHIGQIGADDTTIDVTLSLDTAAYASGDVLAEIQTVASVFRVSGGTAILQSLIVLDEDDQGQALDVVIMRATGSLGTENAAVTISDADARNILGIIQIAAADFIDLGGNRVATKQSLGMMLKPTTGTDLFVGAISRGTGTYTASGIRLILGLMRN